jgi:ankyrin repeat protein
VAREGGCDRRTQMDSVDLRNSFRSLKLCGISLDKLGANVNGTSGQERSPLYYATWNRNFECMQLLIDKGAKCNDESDILHMAISTGHVECAKLLVENGADVNKRDRYGFGPIHRAVERVRVNCLKYLIEKGANVNTASDLYTPLSLATWKNNFDCAKILIENGANVNGGTRGVISPLFHAYENKNEAIMKLLFSNGANPYNDVKLLWNDKSSVVFIARKTFTARRVIFAMISAESLPRLGQTSHLKLLPRDIIRYLSTFLLLL